MINNPTVYIGLDPGKKGGVAFIKGDFVDGTSMPDTELDTATLIGAFKLMTSDGKNIHAVIEQVSSSPQMGVTSSFTFGRGYGFLRGVLIANAIPFTEVRPQLWMKTLGIRTRKKKETTTQWKNHLRGIAQQRFPSLELWKGTRNKGEQLAVCDALLIAEYCRITNRGE